MSTLMALEQRKHDLRCRLVKSAKRDGKGADATLKVYRKILEIQRAQEYLRRGYPCLTPLGNRVQ